MGGGSSSSTQNSEGDLIFNNVDYGDGSGGGGAGLFKNFNVGRENTLEGNIFNMTDMGATKNALAAAVSVANNANDAVTKGAEFTKDTALKAIEAYGKVVDQAGQQVTEAQVTSANATEKAMDYVFESSKTAEERQSENLIKYGTYGGIAVLTVIAIAAAKGAK